MAKKNKSWRLERALEARLEEYEYHKEEAQYHQRNALSQPEESLLRYNDLAMMKWHRKRHTRLMQEITALKEALGHHEN